ncbi:GNAT family N-acetyltransferase [Lysinibacillus sphaericus]
MAYNIEKLDKNHFEESLRLSEYAFQYKVPSEKREKRLQLLNEQDVYGIFQKDALAAKLHLLSMEVWMGNGKYPMGGIAGVATYPEYRRNGFVRRLLSHALEVMNDKRQTISMLHPFDIQFYRKFGWEVFSYFNKLYLTKKDLIPIKKTKGSIKRFTRETYPSELNLVYNQYASQHNGMLVRTKEWWKERSIGDLWIAIFYDENQDPQGYLCYEVKNEKMKVEEFIPLSAEARHGLWNFICQHDSMVNEAEMVLNPNDPLSFLLGNSRVKVERYPYFMCRIVNVEKFLKAYIKNIEFDDRLMITIRDEQAEWNNGTYIIERHGIRKSQSVENTLEMDINTLSAALFGVYTPKALMEMGKIEGTFEETTKMQNLINGKSPFFYDFF